MSYFRRARNRIFETDNIILLMIGIGIGLAIVLAGPQLGPYVIPTIGRGIYCENVGPPMGENHRSLLALKDNDQQDLGIEVKLPNEQIQQGDDLEVWVMMRNNDIGPINLFMPEVDPSIGSNAGNQGVRLEIENVVSRQIAQDGRVYTVPSPTFDEDQMHLLKSHSTCSVVTVIDAATLATLGLVSGEYNVRAVYQNSNAGVAPPIEDGTPLIFPSQGVWTGEVRSDAVRLVITAAPAPASP